MAAIGFLEAAIFDLIVPFEWKRRRQNDEKKLEPVVDHR